MEKDTKSVQYYGDIENETKDCEDSEFEYDYYFGPDDFSESNDPDFDSSYGFNDPFEQLDLLLLQRGSLCSF